MPYTDAGKAVMLDGPGLAAAATHLSIHTSAGSPGSSGAFEATGGSPAYARKVPSFGLTAAGVLPLSVALVFDLPAGTYRWVGLWSSGTFLGYGQLPIDRILGAQDVVTINKFDPNLNS